MQDREIVQSLIPDALRVPLEKEKVGQVMSEGELWGALGGGGQGRGSRTGSESGSSGGTGACGNGGNYVYSRLERSEYGLSEGGVGSRMSVRGKGSGNGITGGLGTTGHPEYPVMNPYDDGWWKN